MCIRHTPQRGCPAPSRNLIGDVPHADEAGRIVTDFLQLGAQGGVRLDCRGIELGNVIAADDALPLALAVAELITNAIKYAHPGGTSGRLWLGCRTTESGAFVVTVSDDGVGLPEGFVPGDGSSLGFRTVRSLMRQIGATISFETDSLGLSITLTLPPRGALRALLLGVLPIAHIYEREIYLASDLPRPSFALAVICAELGPARHLVAERQQFGIKGCIRRDAAEQGAQIGARECSGRQAHIGGVHSEAELLRHLLA